MKAKKLILTLMTILAIIFCNLQSFVLADTEINSAHLKVLQGSERHLQFYNGSKWITISCLIVGYENEGTIYPAYCLNRELPGAEAYEDGYTVSINETIKDEVLWRTIISGYPYKTIEELGVETKWDAYTATKQAIYCILYNRDVKTQYRGMDERGEKIVNAMDKMVSEGRNGSKTIKTANVNINKIGEIKRNGDYYVQEFKVTSNVPIDKYVITGYNNLPENSKITDLNLKEKNMYSENENFYVSIPAINMNKDLDYTINIYSACETYPVFYGIAPSSDLQNHAVTYSSLSGYNSSINVKYKTNTGKIKIIKLDEDTNMPIKDIIFTLYSEDNKEIASATTDINGIAYFENLYQGKYIIREKNINNEYLINNENYEVNVIYQNEQELTITNKLKEGQIKIIKRDKDNNSILLKDVEFEILDEKGNIVEKIVTNENGEAISSKLPSFNKKYYIKEIKTQDNYILNDELIEVELEDKYITEIIIDNVKVPEPEPEPTPTPTPEPEPIPEPEPTPNPEPEPEPEPVPETQIEIPVKKLPKTGM